jgi:hypothetical protein
MNSLAASPGLSPGLTSPATAPALSALRLNLLRCLYGLMAFGLGLYVWPDVIHHTDAFTARSGVPVSLLAGLGATAALGIRYPQRMLPVLIFEIVWKAIFLIAFALPLYLAHRLDAATAANAGACLIVLIFIPVIPWRHVVSTYLLNRSERWK